MITNGQAISLPKTILAVFAACFPEHVNFTGTAGPWTFFFNREQGIWVVRSDPVKQIVLWGRGVDALRDGLIAISRDVTYEQIMAALEEVTVKLREQAARLSQMMVREIHRMKKLDKFYTTLGDGIRARKEVSTKFKKYQLPQ